MLYKQNKTKEHSRELFKNPTKEYRGTPFWGWNCRLNEEILAEQIDYIQEMGFGGFHIHSRIGTTEAYLGDNFMNMVRFCVSKAKEKNMLTYLYDEDTWPSGYAGGYVTQNPRYRQRKLEFTTEYEAHFPSDIADNEGKTYLLAVYDIILNNKGELQSYSIIDEKACAKGTKWYAFMKTMPESPYYNNQTYADTLSKEAIDRFIDVTYNAYKAAVGEEFGKTIPSIFTDEPQFTLKKPLAFAHSANPAVFPWTPSLQDSFLKTYGYDILEKLPEIVWDLADGAVSTARYHYHDHTAERFAQSYADNLGKWCDENGIALTGHMMHEPTLDFQTMATGEAMRSYRAFKVPGIDMLANRLEIETAKQCQSAVHQYGREAMLSELYGVTGWEFDFRGHKLQGDWQAALGVTVRVPHLSWVSMAGESKRDYPASINYQVPWYKEYKYIEDHFARVNTALTRGKPCVRLGVIHPIESYWINYGPLDTSFAKRKNLDEKFRNITRWLLYGTIDFDFIAESLLKKQANEKNGRIAVGEMRYDAILVPDCITMRRSTLEILKEFKKCGGEVIFAGNCPKYIDAVLCDDARELYDSSTCVQFERTEILEAVQDYREIEIKNEYGDPSDNLIYNLREDGEAKWLFIAEAAEEPYNKIHHSRIRFKDCTWAQNIRIYIQGEYKPIVYDTVNGETYIAEYKTENGRTIIDFPLHYCESLLLKLTKDAEGAKRSKAKIGTPTKTIRFLDRVRLERCEPNVLLLDRAEYSLNGEAFNAEEEILRLDNICREKMGWPRKGGHMAQPWAVKAEETKDYLSLRFNVNSEIDIEGTMLAIEDAEKLEISFNGERIEANVCGWYVDKAIKTVKLPKINKGKNQLVVKLPFGKRTNTEWCYIIGDFNVVNQGAWSAIVSKSDLVGFSTLTSQGLPFYGGSVIYKTEIETPKCNLKIDTTAYRGALVKVLVDGVDRGNIVFSPYSLWVENIESGKHTVEFVLYGTRTNTFDALHDTHDTSRSPGAWRTVNDQWNYEYNLKDFGILASPVIEVYE